MRTDQQVRDEIRLAGEWFAVSWAGDVIANPRGVWSPFNPKSAITDDGDYNDDDDPVLIGSDKSPGYCTQCDTDLQDMSVEDRDLHMVRAGCILVGCEGYYTPVFIAAFRVYLDDLPGKSYRELTSEQP